MLQAIIEMQAGKFFTITFVKKDGTIRTINGRTGVKKHLKGGVSTLDKDKFLTVYSIADAGYRAINKNTILTISIGGMVLFNRTATV
jgi:hypothetical protein